MASYTKPQHLLQKQHQVGSAAFTNQMSVLAQAKPAIVSPSTPTTNNSFNHSTGALSEKINTALNLSSTALSQQERTDISKLFSNYGCNDVSKQKIQQNKQHIEDDNVLMNQNASNQMRQAAVMAAVASQQKVRLSATERLALTAKRPLTSSTDSTTTAAGFSSSMQSRQTTTDGSNASSTPMTGSKSTSSLPTLETLLAVQRQLQQHTRQNLNSALQHQMVISNKTNNNTDKLHQYQDAAPKLQQNTNKQTLSKQNSHDSLASNYQPHAQCKKPLPPSPPKSPSLSQQQQANAGPKQMTAPKRCPPVMTYEKELPPLPQSVSPSTTCTTTDESQMNSLESHQSSPATSLVSIPPPPPPISSYLEQYDEVNSACRQSNSSTPSTIATSDISSVKQYSFAQNCPNFAPISKENHQYQQQQQQSQDCKPKPPTLAPKPTQFNYRRVLQNQTNHLNETENLSTTSGARTECANNYNQTLKQHDQIAFMKKEFSQLMQNSYSQNVSSQKVVTDSDSNESSSAASNVSYDISYKPQLNYQQHVFTRTSASLPCVQMPAPPPPPPANFSNHQQQTVSSVLSTPDSGTQAGGFDEVDSAFRFPTPPPLDMLLDQGDEDDEVKKPAIQSSEDYDDEDFQCRIPTPPDHKSMSTVLFQDMHIHPHHNHQPLHRKQSLSPPNFDSTPTVQPPALFRQSHQLQQASQQVQQQPRRISQPSNLSAAADPVSTPQLTVHITNNESGLLSTAAAATNANSHLHHHHQSQSVNHHYNNNHHHHHMMLTSLAASSSSPSSSSDGDGQSSNSSSSTSGIHSSIDSPSSSNSKLDDFNYSASRIRENAVVMSKRQQSCLPNDNLTNNNLKNISTKLTSTTTKQQQKHHPATAMAGVTGAPSMTAAKQTTTTTSVPSTTTIKPKPALKQKKTVSFSDKVELVACAEEQCDDHLPNPLLARVLAGELQ